MYPVYTLQLKTGFNTQPPEGGWARQQSPRHQFQSRFNTQPPEGGWTHAFFFSKHHRVSTHSRLKAAGAGQSKSPHG